VGLWGVRGRRYVVVTSYYANEEGLLPQFSECLLLLPNQIRFHRIDLIVTNSISNRRRWISLIDLNSTEIVLNSFCEYFWGKKKEFGFWFDWWRWLRLIMTFYANEGTSDLAAFLQFNENTIRISIDFNWFQLFWRWNTTFGDWIAWGWWRHLMQMRSGVAPVASSFNCVFFFFPKQQTKHVAFHNFTTQGDISQFIAFDSSPTVWRHLMTWLTISMLIVSFGDNSGNRHPNPIRRKKSEETRARSGSAT